MTGADRKLNELIADIANSEIPEFSATDIKLYHSLLNKIEKGFTKASDTYIQIACALWQIYTSGFYRIAHYKNIDDFAFFLFDLKKSATHNYINVIERFGQIENHVALGLKDEFKGFKCSQLVRMLPLPDDKLALVKPDWTVRKIIELGKSSLPDADALDPDADSGNELKQKDVDVLPFTPEIESDCICLCACDNLDEIIKNRKKYEAAFSDLKQDKNFKKKKIRYELVLVYE